MSTVDLPLPRCSLPTGHHCGNGSRACRFERLTLPEKTGLATPPVVLPAQKKPRTKAGFDGLPAPLTGAANVGQELTKPCPGDMSMINYLHNTGSVHDMHLSDAVTSADRASRRTPLLPRPAAGLHALRGRS
jgi:hypothetical protein